LLTKPQSLNSQHAHVIIDCIYIRTEAKNYLIRSIVAMTADIVKKPLVGSSYRASGEAVINLEPKSKENAPIEQQERVEKHK